MCPEITTFISSKITQWGGGTYWVKIKKSGGYGKKRCLIEILAARLP